MSKKLLNLCLMAIMMVYGISAYALGQKDGVYQIGSAQDFKDFAALVNSSEPYACAELTTDIDLGLIDLGEGTDGAMIGKDGQDFQGTFDGKGHSITINYFSGSGNGTALFRNVGIKALIQNLKVQGTITSTTKFAAGIAAWNSGNIRGCYVDVNVVSSVAGDATHAGIAAVAYRGTVIENCLAKFTINGATTQNCGGLVGWCENRINIANCLVINDGCSFDISNGGSANIGRNVGNLTSVDLEKYNADPYANRPTGATSNNYVTNQWGDNVATTVVPYDELADGKICYQLNTDQSKINWVQRIGTDPFPVPAPFGTGQVYASGATGCDGKAEGDLTYSNAGTVQATAHTFDKYGVCTTCGCFNFDYEFDHKDRAIILKTADDIFRAEGWNRIADGFKLNMKMANDIEVISEPGQNIFNTSNWVDGNFDGDGHTLTIEMSDLGNNASFIPEFSGTFKNVIMHGSISTNGQYAGSVTSHTRNSSSVIKNVYSDINIYTTHTGDNTTGGFVGVGETDYRIENCIYAGTIEGIEGTECLAGISGWSSGNCTMVNVAFLGDLINAGGDSKLMSRQPSKVIPSNSYFLNDCGVEEDTRFTQIEEADIASGKLAFLLNANQQGGENFYQVIGTDPVPMPFAKAGGKVYAAAPSYRCDGTPEGNVQYSNTETTITIPPHNYVGGFCTVCDHIDENYLTPAADGWYEIGTADQLIWWSHYVADVNLGASARLTADIDMTDQTSDKPYAIVGNEQTPFYGSFDGQFHTISNFKVSYPGQRGVGLIGVMNSRASSGDGMSDADARSAEGVFIKNVVLDETCEIEGLGYCGIVGMTASWAGHVTFLNVGMDGHVVCTEGANAGGVLGCVMGSTCHITIDNCYMTGDCDGPNENGSFSGWLGSYCEIKNCYAIGTVTGSEGEDTHKYFARYNTATITNCYTLKGGTIDEDGHHIYRINEDEIANGKFTYLLNGKQFRTSLFYQDLEVDTHPVANPSHGTIVYAAGEYMTANAETLPSVVNKITDFYTAKAEDAVAYTGALEDLQEKIGLLSGVTDLNGLADALDEIYVSEAVVDASIKVYKKYADKVEETKTYLEEHDNVQGEDRDELMAYLEEDAVEILEEHNLPDADIEKEIVRIDEWLALAINKGYVPGTDITKMLVNADFSEGKDKGWDGEVKATGHQSYTRDDGTKLYGIESWSANPFAMTQTVKGLKPGYYLVGVNGAYRPQNNRYSYNHAAQISANGNVNFLQTVIEDYISVADAVDGENCNITKVSALDLGIYDDFVSTSDESGAELIGYAAHGPTGISIAAGAGRYQNYIACEVGEDSVLTIGIANPHSKIGTNEWTGAANVRLTFLGGGDEATDGLATALESQLARAQAILDPEKYAAEIADITEATSAPNYPEELKAALEAAIAEAEAAQTPEQKYAAIQKFSDLFQDIYAGKQAYKKIAEEAQAAEFALTLLDAIISEDDYDAILAGIEVISLGYEEGSISLEDAVKFDITKQIPALAKIVAPKDENGTYQIGTPLQLVYFSATVSNGGQASNAVLTKDINMKDIPFTPIAHGTRYNGVFDGQGHAITNLTIGSADEYIDYQNTGLFSDVENGTVKNLKVQSTIYTFAKFAGGISGYTRNAKIQDCDVDVTVHSQVDGDGTHGGIAGVNETEGTVVENCKVHFVLDGETTTCWGGIFGWSTNADEVKNCIIIAEVVAANMDGSNSVSRNSGNCTATNVYFTTKLNESNIGTYIEATDPRFKTGELTWILNGSSAENPHWFQKLGVDDMPQLFKGSIVWKNGTEYQNSRPNLQLNAFASHLSTATNANQVVVAYTLNADAKNAAINFYAGGELKYSHVLKDGDLYAGGHEVAIDNSLLGVAAGTEMTYELDVTAVGITAPTKIGDSYKVWGPYGMAINNNPASKGFGQILLAESYPEEISDIYISHSKPGALYAFDVNFQPINSADGTPGFYGGLQIKGETPIVIADDDNSYKFDLKDLRFTEDGRLFVARAAGLSASSVYEINPEDLDEPWKPIFKGGTLDEATGVTYVGDQEQCRTALSLAFDGKGEALKMYVLGGKRGDGQRSTSNYNCLIYNLGTATEWTGAPSANYEPLNGKYTYRPGYVGIHEDLQGGLWYIQNTTTEENPALKHFNAEGKENYSNLTSTSSGRIAITADGKYIAIPQGNSKIVLYENTYTVLATGKLFLNPVMNINVSESSITSLAFDYAGNLYVASGGTETFSRYAIPSFTDNKTVTPGAEGFKVGSESGDPDAIKNVNVNENANGSAIYNIAGQRVSKAQKGIFIQDGKKVANK